MAAKRGKTQARRNGRQGIPGWVWGLSGLVLGALIFGYVFMGDQWRSKLGNLPRPNPDATAPASNATTDNGIAEDGSTTLPDRPKPKYDFYTLLPEKEVVIPDAELAEEARAEARKTAAKSPAGSASTTAPIATTVVATGTANTGSDRYLLQAGAFRGSDEADALKAQIALTGEVAHIESAQINGTTVYRVRMGPFATASALAAAKQALLSHGINGAQAIRVK
jgi:cell division protein FtsN